MTGWRVLKPKTTASLDLKAYCMMQNGQAGYSYTDRSAPRLDGPVDLYMGPQAKRANLEICRRPDGTLWLLGEGACGKVYKVRRTQTTDRQQTQTDNRHDRHTCAESLHYDNLACVAESCTQHSCARSSWTTNFAMECILCTCVLRLDGI